MPDKELQNKVKQILKRVPGIQGLNRVRHQIIRLRELSGMIQEDRVVTFPSYSCSENNVALTRSMFQEVMKEWIDFYGVAYLRKSTRTAINAPAGSVLVFAPQALLRIPPTHEEYLKQVRHQTRRDIRLAEKQGYEFKEFVWDDHLDDIYAINTSKEIRQSEPMHGWYTEPVQPRHHSKDEMQYRKYYGAFKDGKLYAYFHYLICGDFAVGKHFIGHAQHLKYGIMNGLVSFTVRECLVNSQMQWIHYGGYNELSLGSFKKHAGCQGYAIILDLEGDQELLKYSASKVRTLWRI